MSRIGRVPVRIPSGVECRILDGRIIIKGSKGVLEDSIHSDFSIILEDDKMRILPKTAKARLSKKLSMLYGTVCRNIGNMVKGVSSGFEEKLELVGVGYKAEIQGRVLKLSLGYSHSIFYPISDGIDVFMEKPTLFKIVGIDKQKVGQTAAEIIRFRPPEPYKGKGVRRFGQFLRIKEGKSK